jgi:hypothetical protein
MKKILILCEGITDQVFLADFIQLFYTIDFEKTENKINKKDVVDIKFKNTDFDITLLAVDGCKNLNSDAIIGIMEKNIANSGKNVVIFDADDESIGNGNNGFENATKSLQSTQQKAKFDFYLWPNNQDNGDIETLLRQLIPKDKQPVMMCIEEHQECLKQTGINGLRSADLKKMLSFYLYAQSIKDTEGRYRDYKNAAFWNLNCEENESLQRLKDFLDKYFL